MARRMIKVTEVTYTVKGWGHFPIDMLRYDCAYPASSEDASLIAQNLENPFRDKKGRAADPWVITLTARSHGPAPNIARWDSFGWHVAVVASTDIAYG